MVVEPSDNSSIPECDKAFDNNELSIATNLQRQRAFHGGEPSTKWAHYFETCKQDCIAINAKSQSSLRKLLDLVGVQAQRSHLPRTDATCDGGRCSQLWQWFSLIAQEKMKRAAVGPLPGVTQDIAGFKLGGMSGLEKRASTWRPRGSRRARHISRAHGRQTVPDTTAERQLSHAQLNQSTVGTCVRRSGEQCVSQEERASAVVEDAWQQCSGRPSVMGCQRSGGVRCQRNCQSERASGSKWEL
ncbi:uncharacterized protein LOC128195355 [Vigna angularis]|uniref:uncharacterized protein LOC128195355 n=1 Tax=Phaseolus angularis TaxID=3914 RepID=UPI0022B517B9|nr:uncharacterized protein LOC128195355 [Vigna angularis]